LLQQYYKEENIGKFGDLLLNFTHQLTHSEWLIISIAKEGASVHQRLFCWLFAKYSIYIIEAIL